MFPLGTALVPGGHMQLRIFEPRYHAMLTECLAGDATFGEVLIERGSEVGGGDVRSDVGTMAHIEQVVDLGGGQTGLLARGTRRVRIDEWLPDDPYPRAEATEWPDEPVTDVGALTTRYADTITALRVVLAAAAELGWSGAPATFEAPDDPFGDPFALVRMSPLDAYDTHRLLMAPDLLTRLDLLLPMLEDQRVVLTDLLASS